MTKREILFCILLILTLITKSLLAQNNDTIGVSNILKANFLFPGLSYEQKVSKFKTFYFSAHLNSYVARSTDYYGSQYYLFAGPAIDVEFRNYYNFNMRSKRNLRTNMNSVDYIAPIYIATYVNSPANTQNRRLVQQIGVVWGMQRNYSRRFSLDINGGIGYLFNAKEIRNQLWPILQLRLGFWLNNKSKRHS